MPFCCCRGFVFFGDLFYNNIVTIFYPETDSGQVLGPMKNINSIMKNKFDFMRRHLLWEFSYFLVF